MFAAKTDAPCLTAIATLPSLTSHDTLHWDGSHPAVRDVGLPRVSAPAARAAVPAQGQPVMGHRTTPPIPPRARPCLAPSPAPATAWATEAAGLTFSLGTGLLEATIHAGIPRVTGVLLWRQGDAQVGAIPPGGHSVLLVQTISTWLDGECVELVPHLPADDPLLAHIELVLQAARTAEDAAGRLYAEALADALAVHFLHRYAACQPAVREGTDGLPPAMLRRTLAYIQAHLAEALPLAALAAVVQVSPNHFARLFKQATGQTPHHYVLACRVARAKQLLAETDLPLSAIGFQVGWTDQSYFTALFRQHVAMTPKAYRAATRQT
jgi:AraC-like DNA-binding protein